MSYQERLQAGVLALQKFESTAGQVVKVEIGHDSDCGVFGSGPCTCCPDIDLLVGTSVYTIDKDGVPHALTNS